MAEFSHQGLNLFWADPLDQLGRRVEVLAGPASPANMLRLVCRVGDGPEQAVQAWPVGVDPESGMQVFAADLPESTLGQAVNWRPVLQNGIKRADPGVHALPVAAAVPAPPKGPEKAPFAVDATFVARVTVPLAKPPITVGDTPDGLRIIYPLGPGGTVKGPHIDGTVEHLGGDWMRVRDDGVGIVGVRALVTTSDGAKLIAEYSGVADFGPDGHSALIVGKPPDQVPIQLTPRFLTSDAKWSWVNRLQCIGIGHVTMSSLLVEYDLYALGLKAPGKTGG